MTGDAHVYKGTLPKSTEHLLQWHRRAPVEAALEPDLPIVDAHHHLFGEATDSQYYRIPDLERDIGAGHRIIGTVCVEAYQWAWRRTGPPALRPVGEVEWMVAATAAPTRTQRGPCYVAAGIVANADLELGSAVADVLDAELEAGQGRLRGIRHHAVYDDGLVGSFLKHRGRPHVLLDAEFRRGFAELERRELSFDAWVFFNQLGELIDLADAFPHTRIVLNHVGGVLGVGEFRARRSAVLQQWTDSLRALAARSNVYVKIGGMGMAMFGFEFEHQPKPASSDELAKAWGPCIDACIEAFGTHRCMFESNFPVDKQSCGYTELWNAFKIASRSLSLEERRDLFYRTACHAYRLPDLKMLGDQASNV